ncbi:hypothetical protein F3Y22_tig00110633pilonHSYRG00146 [Hibiscus syriacus]|uniref:Uncharacterized protein n=1 Tax=Hibiscus syriacus TaxID=106335 RepID=A0A6A2ZZG7_HIBSY|nr:hypothetical protein F3Y22_tig00110633pilonHSYRG00146 [Hibiscus syriacus]
MWTRGLDDNTAGSLGLNWAFNELGSSLGLHCFGSAHVQTRHRHRCSLRKRKRCHRLHVGLLRVHPSPAKNGVGRPRERFLSDGSACPYLALVWRKQIPFGCTLFEAAEDPMDLAQSSHMMTSYLQRGLYLSIPIAPPPCFSGKRCLI